MCERCARTRAALKEVGTLMKASVHPGLQIVGGVLESIEDCQRLVDGEVASVEMAQKLLDKDLDRLIRKNASDEAVDDAVAVAVEVTDVMRAVMHCNGERNEAALGEALRGLVASAMMPHQHGLTLN